MRQPESPWTTPREVSLATDEVHVWRAPLDAPPAALRTLEHTLAMDERARAERFQRPEDRAHFVARRGVLRAILGRYLGREPATLCFHDGPFGKPAVAQGSNGGAQAVTFSVSHSRGLVLYAVAQARSVGVDLEYLDADVPHEQIAERFFSVREREMLRALPVRVRREAFFACWTRKEAYLKARGTGLMLPLSLFDVSVKPHGPAALLSTREQGQEAASWSLRDLTPASDYVAALAVEGRRVRLRCLQYPSASAH